MLLAAGNAQRLRPLTDKTPKPMLVIAGRPILEHNVRLLVRHGIRDIIINLHHKPEVIQSHFGDGSEFGARIRYSWEPELLGTAGAVKRVESEFAETFLVMYGDNLTDCNLTRLMAFHRACCGCATMALFYREDVTASGIVRLDDEDRILEFLEKPRPDQVFSHFVNAGILVLEPSILPRIPAGVSDFGRDVLPNLLVRRQPVFGYRMNEGLWWIDTPSDYARTRALTESGQLHLK
jgi:mannose-1-phosphate guanylyltransferase